MHVPVLPSLLKKGVDGCDLKGCQETVLSVNGVVIEAEEMVFDKDPRVVPSLTCAGQSAFDYYEGRRKMAGNDTSSEHRAKRHGGSRRAPKHGANPGKRGQKATREAPSGSRNPVEGTTTTYWQGPGRIYTGTVYAVRHGEGMVAVGLFNYVRPLFVSPSNIDTEWDPYTLLSSLPAGQTVYTPFEYNLHLTPSERARTYSRLAN